MRRLLLLRHGRTAWNADLRAQGHTDIALDDEGLAQARAAAPGVAALAPSLLWSSDLARAAVTADVVGEACRLDVVLEPRLREVDVGARAGLTPEEFAARWPAEHAAWAAGAAEPLVPGEEPATAMAARMGGALRELVAALGPDELGVAVTHGWCAKVALVDLLGLPTGSHAVLRGLDNCHGALLVEGGRGMRLAGYNLGFSTGAEIGVPKTPSG